MAKINVRSPYFVNISSNNLTSATIEILIYTGAAEYNLARKSTI